MKKEITKGTQKFIWHMAAFFAVFILVLVILLKFVPEPNTSGYYNTPDANTSTSETTSQGTDFDSVKDRVDNANNTTGKEIQSLYTGEGKTSMQKQMETRLFFSTIKNILFCAVLVVLLIVLIRNGILKKKIKGILGGDDNEKETPETETPHKPAKDSEEEEADADPPASEEAEEEAETPSSETDASADWSDAEESGEAAETEEPLLEDGQGTEEAEPDEKEVAENCKL